MTSPPGDSGLAGDRTSLAWQRTALSIVAGAAVMVRFTRDVVGLVPLLLLGTAIVLATIVLVGEHLWYRARRAAAHVLLGPGVAGAALAIALTLMALAELTVLAFGA